MRDVIERPTGRVRVHHVLERFGRATGKSTTLTTAHPKPEGGPGFNLWTLPHARRAWIPNDVLYEWAALVGSLLTRQGVNYGIGGMYIEFENVPSPGNPVAVPDLTREADQGVSYYNTLISSPDRDYLRVPLVGSTITSSDPAKFPKGNVPTFFAQTQGTVGVHGKAFGDANNSTVFGGALVAFVDETDATQDLVFSRFYLDPGLQQIKLATSQVGIEWALELK